MGRMFTAHNLSILLDHKAYLMIQNILHRDKYALHTFKNVSSVVEWSFPKIASRSHKIFVVVCIYLPASYLKSLSVVQRALLTFPATLVVSGLFLL